MNYIPLIVLVVASVFYVCVRFYLNKYKGFEIPLIPERYHDNPFLTLVQALITMGGILLGYIVVSILFQ